MELTKQVALNHPQIVDDVVSTLPSIGRAGILLFGTGHICRAENCVWDSESTIKATKQILRVSINHSFNLSSILGDDHSHA